jgi:DNA-binding MarR family transcriptional regulator
MSRINKPVHPARMMAHLGREMGARAVLFHEAVANRLGLTATEHKCLDLMMRAGEPLTAGQLAELTGLTTGAITGIVDRLEKAGYARRERSQTDRRQVRIHALPPTQQEFLEIFQSLGKEVAKVQARYSDQELAVIQDFLTHMIEIFKDQTARLREQEAKLRVTKS